jgi:ubiquinone/menaquinone biosynthesis C-methylase UbiE
MKINNPEKRLKKFWGLVDKKHIELIAEFIQGHNVLDMGCGLGTTTQFISHKGFECIGIDYNSETIAYCKKTYPECNFLVADAEQLPFEDKKFDTIILRDALHHFYKEANFDKVKKEILRVGKEHARIIFFDPNINFILKIMRKISFHQDEECDFETAKEIMKELNGKIIHQSFNTVYSLPLSGGYVGLNFTPDISFIQNNILRSELFFERLFNKTGLGRQLCWRYLIAGQL